MKTRFIQKFSVKLRLGYLFLGTTVLITSIVLFFTFFVGVNTIPVEEAKASTNTTFPSNSFVMKMGITPQTVGNSLKPYGLIYEMIEDHNIPVYWVINESKAKDGVDFTYNARDYKGGSFIIDQRFINAYIYNRILYWLGQGVQGAFTFSDLTVPVYTKIEYFPRILIDNLAGLDSIIVGYMDNAGIPSTGYTIGTPDDANQCFDVWVNPHGDPTWATHGNLYDFVTKDTGFIWSQCHAVSMLEDVIEPVSPNRQMNFLSVDGLQCWKVDGCGSAAFPDHAKKPTAPFTHNSPGHPIMQFIGDAATGGLDFNGSEKWFIPLTSGSWRPTTDRLVTSSDGTSPGEGVLLVYGPAYGNTDYGYVCYSAGHDYNEFGPTEPQVVAQRAFFNFLLLAGKERKPLVVSDIEAAQTGLNWYEFSAIPSGGYTPYTYSWSSTIGGTFMNPDSSTTVFLSPYVSSPTSGIISVMITDSCSRVMNITQFITVTPSPLPVTLTEFTAKPQGTDKVVCNWKTSSETNNRFFTLERSRDLKNFTIVGNVPTLGNGAIPHSYTLNDYKPYSGKSYYRLSQTDINGDTEYFDPVMVNRNSVVIHQKLNVRPNPFTNHFNLTLTTEEPGEFSARIYDLNGRMIYDKTFTSTAGSSVIRIDDVDKLPSGQYIFKVEDGKDFSEMSRIVKY